jgi:hypothetical protein
MGLLRLDGRFPQRKTMEEQWTETDETRPIDWKSDPFRAKETEKQGE